MKESEFNSLSENDKIRLNFASAKQFKGRFNSYDHYQVRLSRNGKMIKDDNGAIRFLNEIYTHFYKADKYNKS